MSSLKLDESQCQDLNGQTIAIHSIRLMDLSTSIDEGFIIISEGRIQSLGSMADGLPPHENWIDGAGWMVFPGFVNGHTHVAMSFFRDLTHDTEQMIENLFFPVESGLDESTVYALSFPSIAAGLKSGVTSFVDHYYFIEGVARALSEFGARGFIGETLADLGGAFPSRTTWHRVKSQLEKESRQGLNRYLLAPHAMDTVSPELLKEISAFSATHKIPLHMHLSQTQGEWERIQKRAGKTPVELADECGALGPLGLFVHLVTANDTDIQLLKKRGAYIGLCPSSQVLYENLAPLNKFYESELVALLGTDCAASHDSMDIMQEIRTLYLFLKQQKVPGDTARQVLETVWTAPAQWLREPMGALKTGFYADLVFAQDDLSTWPINRPLVHLIMSMSSRNIRHVMINGVFQVFHGELLGVDEKKGLAQFEKANQKMWSKLEFAKT